MASNHGSPGRQLPQSILMASSSSPSAGPSIPRHMLYGVRTLPTDSSTFLPGEPKLGETMDHSEMYDDDDDDDDDDDSDDGEDDDRLGQDSDAAIDDQELVDASTEPSALVQPTPDPLPEPFVIRQPMNLHTQQFSFGSQVDMISPKLLHCVIMSPVPQGSKFMCRIVRKNEGMDRRMYPTYELWLEEPQNHRVFLLRATKKKRSRGSYYTITSDIKDPSGYDRKASDDDYGNPNVLGLKGPRKMTILMNTMTSDGLLVEKRPMQTKDTLIGRMTDGDMSDLLVLRNKSPQWNDETNSFVLNFGGRVSLASVKNFQIVHDNDLDYIIMQFGRTSQDNFTMDCQYPMTPFQAFAFALTSFDAKLACE
ncbi:hypothetical protein BGZ65_006157 [Modicella reniformis]|uniref:Tubby C-terminal domain-containing protein n=1 Tax=Modicella reniformis TaxID=1440133 RepID=A0A9P6LS80_9FUNG|nr:hypothetical protein BGZ65_006157 [Modicella reniformis]